MDDLDKKLEEVYKLAGPDLRKTLDAYFPKDKDKLVDFMHAPYERLGKSPYEFCKDGKQAELNSILISLAQGNLGG